MSITINSYLANRKSLLEDPPQPVASLRLSKEPDWLFSLENEDSFFGIKTSTDVDGSLDLYWEVDETVSVVTACLLDRKELLRVLGDPSSRGLGLQSNEAGPVIFFNRLASRPNPLALTLYDDGGLYAACIYVSNEKLRELICCVEQHDTLLPAVELTPAFGLGLDKKV